MHLVIRADASSENGAGHVMRCASLAEAWIRAGFGPVSLRGRLELEFVKARVASVGIRLTSAEIDPPKDAIVVVDSYDQMVRRWGSGGHVLCRVLVDDLGEQVPLEYDLVWNPNAYGSRDLYPGFLGTTISGPDAIAIRDDVPSWRGDSSSAVAVVFGGGKVPANLRCALALLSLRFPGIVFRGSGEWAPRGWERLDPVMLWEQVADCGRLITAAGSTLWEAAACGIPVVAVCTAPNQRLIYDWALFSGAPGVDLENDMPSEEIARRIGGALDGTRALPRMTNGARSVAERIMKAATR